MHYRNPASLQLALAFLWIAATILIIIWSWAHPENGPVAPPY